MIESVESVLEREGRPMTIAELYEKMPKRKRIYQAVRAAVDMGYVKRDTKGGYSMMDHWTYEYLPPEKRAKK